jgi:hypothetical protein
MALFIQETFINADKGYMFGESDVYETYCDTRGELFRDLQREYGRCLGKMYRDTDEGTKAIGWVFLGRQRYEDTGEPYLREVWVSIHTAPDTVTRESHYLELAA